MAMRVTKERLHALVTAVSSMTGKGYVLDKHAGGYQLQNAGGNRALSSRYTAGEMEGFLQGMLTGASETKR